MYHFEDNPTKRQGLNCIWNLRKWGLGSLCFAATIANPLHIYAIWGGEGGGGGYNIKTNYTITAYRQSWNCNDNKGKVDFAAKKTFWKAPLVKAFPLSSFMLKDSS